MLYFSAIFEQFDLTICRSWISFSLNAISGHNQNLTLYY